MTKDIIKYPTPLSKEYATDVRNFNDELITLVDDIKDTITECDLEALCAFQIGSYYNIIVFKDEKGELVELINPRMISHSGKITSNEKTAYYGDISAEITRFENISIVYQDLSGENKTLKASGDLAILLQRKLDYSFGSTFLHRLDKDEREKFELKLQNGTDSVDIESCPTVFNRDKILKVINIILLSMVALLISSFFMDGSDDLATLWDFELYGSLSVLILNVIYFFYAQYEGKKYTQCSSCQMGNIVGNVVINIIKLTTIMGISYFVI